MPKEPDHLTPKQDNSVFDSIPEYKPKVFAPKPTTDEVEAIRERRAKITGQFVSGRSYYDPDDDFMSHAPADIDTLLSLYDQLCAEAEGLRGMVTDCTTIEMSLRQEVDALRGENARLIAEHQEVERAQFAVIDELRAEVSRLSSEVGEVWEKAIIVVKDLLPELEKNYEAEKPMGFIGASYELGQTKDIIEALEAARDAAQKKN